MDRTLAVLFCPLFLAGATPGAWGADVERPRRVLMVHSFGGAVPPFTTHSMAFQSAIKRELGADVDLDQVSLENARYAEPDLEEAFAEFLTKRLAKWQPDLVVPAGAPAGRFVAKYRDRLFPGKPVIYSWVDIRTLPADAITNNATFVGQSFKLNELAEDMLQLDPETNNVVVVFGATSLERYWAAEFQKAFEPFTERVKFTYVNDLSFEQMLDLVSKLPPHSFVQLGLVMRDASGVTFNQDEVLKRLSEVSRAPVNGINESRLPPGSVVLFRQPTAWELYRWHVVGALAVIATQAVLISALLVQRRRRNLAEMAQKKAQAEVQEKRAQVEHVARVATLGELTATLTHELRQPLNAIRLKSALGTRHPLNHFAGASSNRRAGLSHQSSESVTRTTFTCSSARRRASPTSTPTMSSALWNASSTAKPSSTGSPSTSTCRRASCR